jgi:hypothetical protein
MDMVNLYGKTNAEIEDICIKFFTEWGKKNIDIKLNVDYEGTTIPLGYIFNDNSNLKRFIIGNFLDEYVVFYWSFGGFWFQDKKSFFANISTQELREEILKIKKNPKKNFTGKDALKHATWEAITTKLGLIGLGIKTAKILWEYRHEIQAFIAFKSALDRFINALHGIKENDLILLYYANILTPAKIFLDLEDLKQEKFNSGPAPYLGLLLSNGFSIIIENALLNAAINIRDLNLKYDNPKNIISILIGLLLSGKGTAIIRTAINTIIASFRNISYKSAKNDIINENKSEYKKYKYAIKGELAQNHKIIKNLLVRLLVELKHILKNYITSNPDNMLSKNAHRMMVSLAKISEDAIKDICLRYKQPLPRFN